MITSSPKTQNAVIDEILKDLESVEHLTEEKIRDRVNAAAEANGVDQSQMAKLIEKACIGAGKGSNGEV